MQTTYKLDKIKEIVNQFVEYLHKNNEKKIIAFYGEMGSGKTTLIKEICSHFGVKNEVTSPTFAIINEYTTNHNNLVYHFDFYRLKNLQEALDIGTEDYFYSGNYCFLEWPEKIEEILPEETVKVEIKVISENEREIFING